MRHTPTSSLQYGQDIRQYIEAGMGTQVSRVNGLRVILYPGPSLESSNAFIVRLVRERHIYG